MCTKDQGSDIARVLGILDIICPRRVDPHRDVMFTIVNLRSLGSPTSEANRLNDGWGIITSFFAAKNCMMKEKAPI